MENEQPMSSLKPAAKEQELCRAEERVLSLPAHPNTPGNAHGHPGSTLRAGEEEQGMRQQMKAEVGLGCSKHHWGPPRAGGEAKRGTESTGRVLGMESG